MSSATTWTEPCVDGQIVVQMIKRGSESRTSKLLQPQLTPAINRMLEVGVRGTEKMVSEVSDFKLYAEDHKETVAANVWRKRFIAASPQLYSSFCPPAKQSVSYDRLSIRRHTFEFEIYCPLAVSQVILIVAK